MPQGNGRDEVQFKVPMLGEIRAKGPLIVAVICAIAFAVGLIGMQIWTFRQFQRDLDRMYGALIIEVQQARQDRQEQRDMLVRAGCLSRNEQSDATRRYRPD